MPRIALTRRPSGPGSRRLVVLLLATVLAAGCGSDDPRPDTRAADAPAQPGGTAVVALSADPQVLNSLIRTSTLAGQILAELNDGLVEMGEDLLWHGRIATSWDVAADGLSVTYHLQPWAWSDGTPLTARDAVASFELFRDPRVASPLRGFFDDVLGAVALDSATVRYDLARPLPDPLSRTLHAILPAHVTATLDPAEVRNWPLNQAPLSSGPFLLESWDHNRSLTLVRNPRYSGPAPLLDRVVFRILPEESARVIALETGEVDLVDGLVPATARRLEREGSVTVVPTGGRQFYYLLWNCRREQFADAGTRRALSRALDRGRLIESVLSGYATPAGSPIPPVLWNHDARLTADDYDPDRARRELATAGWRDDDGDGVVERDGRPLSFTLLTRQGDAVRESGAVVLQQNLQAVGAAVSLLVLEHATGLARIRSGDFDAYLGLFTANLFGDPSALVRSGDSGGYNFGAYANARVDSLLEAALASSDTLVTLPLWHAVQAQLAADPPAAYLCYPERLVGVGPRLRNVRPHMLSPFNNLREWWIPLEQRRYRSAPGE